MTSICTSSHSHAAWEVAECACFFNSVPFSCCIFNLLFIILSFLYRLFVLHFSQRCGLSLCLHIMVLMDSERSAPKLQYAELTHCPFFIMVVIVPFLSYTFIGSVFVSLKMSSIGLVRSVNNLLWSAVIHPSSR